MLGLLRQANSLPVKVARAFALVVCLASLSCGQPGTVPTGAAGPTEASPVPAVAGTPPLPVPVPPPPGPEVFAGAGDIAICGSGQQDVTARLLDTIGGTLFTLGDNVYSSGTRDEFRNCYDRSWGRHR